MADDPQPTVKVSPGSAALLTAATVTAGTLNTVVACFLLADPVRVGGDGVAQELLSVRNASLAAIAAAAAVAETAEEVDLDRVAHAAAETARGALSLAFRWLEVFRRRGELGPLAEAEVERMEGILQALGEMLPGALGRVWGR